MRQHSPAAFGIDMTTNSSSENDHLLFNRQSDTQNSRTESATLTYNLHSLSLIGILVTHFSDAYLPIWRIYASNDSNTTMCSVEKHQVTHPHRVALKVLQPLPLQPTTSSQPDPLLVGLFLLVSSKPLLSQAYPSLSTLQPF
jgi:hypothetical protein